MTHPGMDEEVALTFIKAFDYIECEKRIFCIVVVPCVGIERIIIVTVPKHRNNMRW
jgi:hypothetical protein